MRKEFNEILYFTGGKSEGVDLRKLLSGKEYLIKTQSVESEQAMVATVRLFEPQVILMDYNITSSKINIDEILIQFKKIDDSIPLILIIDEEAEKGAINLLNRGIRSYIFRDRPGKLPFLIKKYLSHDERKFKTLVENSSDATLILTPDGTHSYVSPAITTILGYSREEVLNLDLYELLASEEKEKVQEAMTVVLELPGVTGPSIEVCAHKKTGELICLEVTLTNLLHISDIHGIAINLRDITEYKLAEEAIIESEEKYRSFFMNSMDGVLVTVTDGTILAANPAACSMLQMTEKEICEVGRFGIVDLNDPRVMEAINERKRTGRVKAEITMKRKDGTFFPAELTSSVYVDAKSRNRTSLIIRDLSEKSQVTEERNFQADLLDRIGQAVYATDTCGFVNYWNQTATRIYGWTKEEALGRNILDFSTSGKLKELCSNIRDVLKTGKNWVGEVNAIRKDGKEFPAYVTETPVYNSKGELNGFLVISSDITEQKKSEIKLRELNSSLEKYTVELINANKGLEQYSFIVSHNLRAPVANLLGLKGLYLQKDHPEELRQRFLTELFENIDRLDNIIADLNSILKSKTEISEKKEAVKFQELVNSVTESINHLIIKEKVEVVTDFSEVPQWHSIKGYLHSVFYNLIFNSIKYRKPDQNPKIEIRSWSENEKLYLSFKDNGLGIDLENKKDQLFRLYKRFHHHVEGKGMGLFMVKTQVEMMGGEISVLSEINKGAEFIVSFNNSKTETEYEEALYIGG
ncbi:PAS domain-containing sensor histidine kinase [Salinimicrobium gaetbulicola]|uniref:histidine kinase n=1 Tax=Salinimicrobium gaetbulicola TaxID=999702 RepID=A0ABW3ID47_9FLAO